MTDPVIPQPNNKFVVWLNSVTAVTGNPDNLRRFVKWYFEILRNAVVIGVILYLGARSQNGTLQWIARISAALLGLYILSYVQDHFLKPVIFQNRVWFFVYWTCTILALLLFYMQGGLYLTQFVIAITNAYLQK